MPEKSREVFSSWDRYWEQVGLQRVTRDIKPKFEMISILNVPTGNVNDCYHL